MRLSMSFKREGDDRSQLNVLKKRRVADLLSNYIPEDEATLMKNGRYSCLVCSHRPVFDTVDMLTVHRNGKRHLEGLKCFYGKKLGYKMKSIRGNIKNMLMKKMTSSERSEKPTTRLKPDCSSDRSVDHNIIPTAMTKITTDTTPAHADARQFQTETQMKKKKRKAAESEPLTEQRRRELEHYLKLKSNGWVQDPSGKWIKDENVEFDSDEEEPLPLIPTPESS